MRVDLNNLIEKVNGINLDSSPLLKLSNLISDNKLKEESFFNLLRSLDIQFLKKYSVQSKVSSVQYLLNRLESKISESTTREQNSTVKEILLDSDQSLSREILEELKVVRGELRGLVGIPTNVSQSEVGSINSASIDTVFINPIDERSVSSLKSNINIESKVSKSEVLDKIDRLKRLKNDS